MGYIIPQMDAYVIKHCAQCRALNSAILQAFSRRSAADIERESHFHAGRYENIYIPVQKIPQLHTILAQVKDYAAELLGMSADSLRAGFWFNEMKPGDMTLSHQHDIDDELLSAVYYVEVPPDSGTLVMINGDAREEIQPQAGMFVLFDPAQLHEVTRNESDQVRVSIGINIGPAG